MIKNRYFIFILVLFFSLFIMSFNDSKASKMINNIDKKVYIINNNEVSRDDLIILDNSYAITDLYDGNIVKLSDGSLSTFKDLISNYDSLKEVIYNNLRIKYPKFVVDQVIEQDFKVNYLDDKKVILEYDNTLVQPAIDKYVNVTLICRDYKDYVMFDCNDEIEENLNNINDVQYSGVVALTFDDGPCKNTFQAIEELNNNNMKATFFELGSMMKSYPDAVKAVLDNGFEVASHGYSHKSFLKLGVNGVINELNKTNEIYKEITGNDLSLVRPPYGSINTNIRDNVNNTFIKWSVDSLDWKEKDKFIDNIMKDVKDGDIILMHDIHKTTVDGLSTLLPLLYSKGFKVVTVSMLAQEKGIELEKNKVYFNFR